MPRKRRPYPQPRSAFKRATRADLSAIERVFNQLPRYSLAVDGRTKTKDAALKTLESLPPDCTPDGKHLWIAYRRGMPVGLVDLFEDFPRPGIGFVGLLVVSERFHRRGIGRALCAELERRARRLKQRRLRLVVIDTNPVQGYWKRMGFRRTGETHPYKGARTRRTLYFMEKQLG